MGADRSMFRAEIVADESGARVMVYRRRVAEGTPGWFASNEKAWSNAIDRLTGMAHALVRKAEEIRTMLDRRESR